MKNATLLTVLILAIHTVFAQRIDSIRVIPSHPTPEDVVKVICYAEFNNMPCPMINYSVDISGTTIFVHAENKSGMLTAICNSVDTVPIGRLKPGNYYLEYFKTDSMIPGEQDKDSVYFTVSGLTGVNNAPVQAFKIFPNPVLRGDLLTIEGINAVQEIKIYNAVGQEVRLDIKGREKDTVKLTTANLANGVYFYKIVEHGQHIAYGEFVVKE